MSPVPLNVNRTVTLTEHTKGVPMVAYSPDGRYLASAGLDHTVRIFDAHSLTELRVIQQPAAVTGVAFTGDSQDVLSWGADNDVRLWDACTDCENPQALLRLAGSRVTRSLTRPSGPSSAWAERFPTFSSPARAGTARSCASSRDAVKLVSAQSQASGSVARAIALGVRPLRFHDPFGDYGRGQRGRCRTAARPVRAL